MSAVTAPEIIAGRYKVAARIGAGGMGEVFRARDTTLRRMVAVKVLPAALASRPGFVERFRAEAQATARVSHPNVVQVYDWGSDAGSYFMVMEYVRGRTLREILAAQERLAPVQAAAVADQLLAALEAAHASGLVHRDVKPENILVTLAGEVKVTDFGIAHIAEGGASSGDLVGTAAYAAPEQIRGEAVDGRTDLYAAGCVLYELLCGAPPFEGNPAHVLQEHLSTDVPPPSLEAPEASALDGVVTGATRRDPAQRYPSATAMRAALAEAAHGLPEAPPLKELAAELTSVVAAETQQTIVAPPRRRRRRWPWLVAVILVILVAAAALMVRPLPKVDGLTQAAALASLQKAGLHGSVQTAFSPTTRGTVIGVRSSVISLGSYGLRGGSVALTVSKGPDLRQVPNVAFATSTVAAAEAAVQASGLPLGNVTYQYNQAVTGTVLAQVPVASAVPPGTAVNLTVSKGPQLVAVPTIPTGTVTYAAAVSQLQQAHLSASAQYTYSDAVSGTVIAQSPAGGTMVPISSQVGLTVSQGPAPFSMPSVIGTVCATAQSQLQALGLAVTAVNTSGGSGCTTSKVLGQDPVSGVNVQKGASATLYVP
jgi:beta-lactam-binding protein with PASTA domain